MARTLGATPASRASLRAHGTNKRRKLAIETARLQVAYVLRLLRGLHYQWPTVTEVATALAGSQGWGTASENRIRLNAWLWNGTFAGSGMRVRTEGRGKYRLEVLPG
jgi:hypothetical protein